MMIVERTREPLLIADKPWEEFSLCYCSVLYIDDTWHMWYGAYDMGYEYDCDAYLCYARSLDGVVWEKPELGIIEYGGNTKNNIVYDGQANRANITTVFADDHAPSNERFKGLAQRFLGRDEQNRGIWHCYGAVSEDGLRWRMLADAHYPWNADTQNACFWDQDRYRFYARTWRPSSREGGCAVSTESQKGGLRTIGLSESSTFARFPKAQEVLAPDQDDPNDVDFYASGCTKISQDLYVMFVAAYHKNDDVVRIQAAHSRDGRSFERESRTPLLDLGEGFDSQTIYVAPGTVAGPQPGTFWVYYLGTSVKHNESHPSKTRQAGGFGRFLVDLSKEMAG